MMAILSRFHRTTKRRGELRSGALPPVRAGVAKPRPRFVAAVVVIAGATFATRAVAAPAATAPKETVADDSRPKIAVFAGPTATVLNTLMGPRTSEKARKKFGLPPLRDWHGREVVEDQLTFQRLAAPVTVYVDQFSALPLDRDAADLFAPPDGYLDAKNAFHKEKTGPGDRPVYQIELRPEDGLYPLPYMGRRADGSAWEDWEPAPGAEGRIRQPFYPDASRLFEEIERMGAETTGNIFGRARFDFYRPAPPAGYVHGLPAAERTDTGAGDIPPEKAGVDYFPYTYKGAEATRNNFDPSRATLAKITNDVQDALATRKYRGALWLEGSPRVEDTIYWFNLVIDTDAPIVGVIANRPNRMLSNDGPATIVDAVDFVLSDVWRDADGHNRVGDVVVQDQRITAAREAIKEAPRPGGFGTLGGSGGVIGTTQGMKLAFLPLNRHGRSSDVRYSALPANVPGLQRAADGHIERTDVTVKDETGHLRGAAIPEVELLDFNSWMTSNPPGTPDPVGSRVRSAIARDLGESPLCGLVCVAPLAGHFDRHDALALDEAAMVGVVVVKVSRGNPGTTLGEVEENLTVEGSNLNANKARVLLMACLLRYGDPPPAKDPAHPTEAEKTAVRAHLAKIQAVFDTH
ncbi:MAG TPA: asparaginase domain-containing protein [Opitutus sp.]|nr:asparaginase domain-containing protein [Opitutus sp.]